MDKINILLVDDKPENLLALEVWLKNPEWNLVRALSGEEALKLAIRQEFALVLLDVQMPGMNGFETAEMMRSIDKNRDIPIIFVTAISREQKHVFNGYESGAVDYLFKPLDPIILKSKVSVFAQLAQNQLKLKEFNHQLKQEVEHRRKTEQELQKSFVKIKGQQDLILEELSQAHETQKVLLPQVLPSIPSLTIYHKFEPMAEIGGDFYNVFPIDEEHYGFLVADVTGHGISAALVSFLISGIFMNSIGAGPSPELVLNLCNAYLNQKLPDGKFATVFYGVYQMSSKKFMYSTAAHPSGLLIRQTSNEVIELNTNGSLLGIFPPEISEFPEATVQLETGDKVLLFTDGVVEIFHDESIDWGEEQLKQFVYERNQFSIQEIVNSVYEKLAQYSVENTFDDDVTILGLEVH